MSNLIRAHEEPFVCMLGMHERMAIHCPIVYVFKCGAVESCKLSTDPDKRDEGIASVTLAPVPSNRCRSKLGCCICRCFCLLRAVWIAHNSELTSWSLIKCYRRIA